MTVTVVIFVTLVILRVATVAVGTVVIVTYLNKKQLDNSTTDEIFSGQLFAILAMFGILTSCLVSPISNIAT